MFCGNCPPETRSVEDVRVFPQSVSSYSLTDIYREVLSLSSQEFLLKFYDDCSGKLTFILLHSKQNAIAAVGIPLEYQYDKKLRKWFAQLSGSSGHFGGKTPGEVDDLSSPALTDDLVDQRKYEYSISNFRWEHVDEKRKSKTPDSAKPGDEVRFIVTIEGVPDRAGVDF
ncbi:hypothetical protein CHISP_2654 [Chitinispirillum alkaliphilum]|nr:hypothetical protein CHISP_2654 [Chitinispirillum alkaliphilum]